MGIQKLKKCDSFCAWARMTKEPKGTHEWIDTQEKCNISIALAALFNGNINFNFFSKYISKEFKPKCLGEWKCISLSPTELIKKHFSSLGKFSLIFFAGIASLQKKATKIKNGKQACIQVFTAESMGGYHGKKGTLVCVFKMLTDW